MILEKIKNPATIRLRRSYGTSKKVLILGLGKEGIDTLKFLRKLFPEKILGLSDQRKFADLDEEVKKIIKKDKKVELHLGKNYLKIIKDYEIIVKSPGIPIHLPEIEKAVGEKKITSQTEIFFENCPGKIIGVTGTKGKGTTSSLVYQILKTAKFKVHLIGNIGKPVLSLLLKAKPNDFFIYELSSHQLHNLRKGPFVAVFLNIFPDHLDYYKNISEYVKAKTNIVKHQTKKDFLIYNAQDKIVKKIARKSKAKKIPFSLSEKDLKEIGRFPKRGVISPYNIKAAFLVAKTLGIPEKTALKALKTFKTLPHRLEFVGEFRGTKFYNDAQATIPEPTIFAISALGPEVATIILGGSEKKVSFQKLADKILESQIKAVILFPTTGKEIWQEIVKAAKKRHQIKLPDHFSANNMEEAVKLCYQVTPPNKICLLSTACASFSLFKNYQEKGDLFKKFVKKLGFKNKL